jgi:hypothetical protein
MFRLYSIIKILFLLAMQANAQRWQHPTTQECYDLEVAKTPILIEFIKNNQLDSINEIYVNHLSSCKEQPWSLLLSLFLMSTMHQERIDAIEELEMKFLIQYSWCVRRNKFFNYETVFETHNHIFKVLPPFIKLQNEVQRYLNDLYVKLPIGSRQHDLVGTLIGKHNKIFEYFNTSAQYVGGGISHKSLIQQKKNITKYPQTFLVVSNSYVFNSQMGNSIQFDLLGVEQYLFGKFITGLSLGYGINTTAPNYEFIYNDKVITPGQLDNFAYNLWFGYMFKQRAVLNPYIAIGAGGLFRYYEIENITPSKESQINNLQIYPEIGAIIGKWPYHHIKINCSYRFGRSVVVSQGEMEQIRHTHNISQNDLRVGFSVLFNISPSTRQIVKMVGAN